VLADNPLMQLDPTHCYRALCARDPRFDGRFFVAVGSTRIYCRPICAARTPARRNCAFFPSAAAAEAAGYRPCLRCRPELAPGHASIDAARRTADAAARLLDEHPHAGPTVGVVAGRLGISERHLRRVFRSELGVSPLAFAQTRRLLLAKQLLTDSALPVTEIAFLSGFGSVRRFNAVFQQRYRLKPGEIRKAASQAPPDGIAVRLAYRAPLDWAGLLAFLCVRSVTGVETVAGAAYRRTALLRAGTGVHSGWLEVLPAEPGMLRMTVSASLAPALPAVIARVKSLLDLACDPDEVGGVLGELAGGRPGLRIPGAFDGFEMAVRAILGQQISVAAARTLAGRFAARFGAAIVTPFESLTTRFPEPGQVARQSVDAIAACGIVRARAATIVRLAQALDGGDLVLSPASNVDATMNALRRLPGIGEWTAQYVAMRALAWPDAFPHTDLGIMKALGEKRPRRVLQQAEAWRPWRAYAAMHLWASLAEDSGA
jgi:AraC family transcriptional regulator, regulatory protein of adaptative response / DNA-3-methyladenine glycosylase II